jgi:NAD(P)-dependent dehydrogenase (short-subunit alcohol dehydrogenase family)
VKMGSAMLTRLQEINVLGLHNTAVAWIRSQPDPKNPVGTLIDVNSGLAGKIVPGNSAYSISKLATHRYMEFVEAGEFRSTYFRVVAQTNSP